jgi:hypothetical protein
MRVEIQRYADLVVAKQVPHDLGMNALAEQQRGTAMTQIMEPDAGQASPIQ